MVGDQANFSTHSVVNGSIFLSYAREDDELFVKKLYNDLSKEFDVWWDREKMPNRGLTFLPEIREAIERADRLILIWGPDAVQSVYVRAEWEYALNICKPVLPILRLGDYNILPEQVNSIDVPDFRDNDQYETKFAYLQRQLVDKPGPLGKLVGVPSLPMQFQPRDKDITGVKTHLLYDMRKPVVINAQARKAGMQGMGGIGKTILAVALAHDCEVRRLFRDGILWVSLGQEPNLITRLSDLCRALGDAPQNFSDILQGTARLSELLTDKACLLILDDLWSLDHARVFDAIGSRGSMLITTRDDRLISGLGAQTYEIGVLSEEDSLTLMCRWMFPHEITHEFNKSKQLEQIKTKKASLPPEARQVVHECGYLPLALSLSAAQVYDGMSLVSLLTALKDANLEFLDNPNGSVLKSIKVSIDALYKENASNVQRYLELAIFPEDTAISEAALMTLWLYTGGLKPHIAERLLVTLARRAMLRLEGKSQNRWIKLHNLQHDYVRRTISDIRSVHNALIEAYHRQSRGEWHKGPNDGYFFEYLIYHMAEAERWAELYALLTGSPDWMEAKFVACTGDTSYATDLSLTIDRFKDPLNSDQILILTRLYAARQVIYARVSLYTDTDLKTLVWLGRQTEALAYARLRPEVKERFNGLQTIYRVLHERGYSDLILLSECALLAYRIEDSIRRVYALREVAVALAQVGSIEEALSIARTIENSNNRATALREIAIALVQAKDKSASEVFEEALSIARTIENSNNRATALREIAIALVQAKDKGASEVFEEALSIARAIEDNSRRATALREIAIALVQAKDKGASEIFEEALSIARAIEDNSRRATALREIAIALVQAKDKGASEIFEEALSIARAIEDNSRRATALREIAIALVQAKDKGASEIFEEALSIARAIEDNSRRAMLGELVAILAQVGHFEEALITARSIEDNDWRAVALRELAVALAQANDGPISESFEEALITARSIEDNDWRAAALRELAAALAQVQRFEEALVAARSIEDSFRRAAALRAIAVALAQVGDKRATQVLEDALMTTRAIEDSNSQAIALQVVSILLAQTGNANVHGVVEETLSTVRNAEDSNVSIAALREQMVTLALTERLEDVSFNGSAFEDSYNWAAASRDMAAASAISGDISVAFDTLGSRELAEFVREITTWAKSFEQIDPGLSIRVLHEAIDVISWVRPSWANIRAIVTQATKE